METKRTSDMYLTALDKVLSKRYSHNTYSLNGYQESSVCMELEDDGWIVFNGERGNSYDVVECDTILKACSEFIRKMTHSTEDISLMENELLDGLTNSKRA